VRRFKKVILVLTALGIVLALLGVVAYLGFLRPSANLVSVRPPEPSELRSVDRADERPEATVKRLAGVGRFAFGGVGFAGVISDGETDLKLVLSQPSPDALASLARLYAHGNPQAKAYALAGIKNLSRPRYRELLAVAKASMDEVLVMRGCVTTREPLWQVAKEIDAGGFKF
jgi:hypothetical protein